MFFFLYKVGVSLAVVALESKQKAKGGRERDHCEQEQIA